MKPTIFVGVEYERPCKKKKEEEKKTEMGKRTNYECSLDGYFNGLQQNETAKSYLPYTQTSAGSDP